jgi:hypothetical protein
VYNDLHAFDPLTLTWAELSAGAAGTPPSARLGHGLAALGGRIYVHAGYVESGAGHTQKRARRARRAFRLLLARCHRGCALARCALCCAL